MDGNRLTIGYFFSLLFCNTENSLYLSVNKNEKIMEFKGTKYEWRIETYRNFLSYGCLILADGVGQIAMVEDDFINNIDETKANAILISKAPEMLEMLKILVEQHELGNEIGQYDKARELIKQATEL